MASEEVNEVENEEASEITTIEKNEEEPKEEPKEEQKEEPMKKPKQEATTEPVNNEVEEEAKPKAKAKATPKKLARTVKVVELVECEACNKKMLPKSLRNTHPYYCKGQPRETLPVNRQKASYGSKVEQKLRKEIEDEMKKKYETKNEVVSYSEHEVSCSSATLHEPIEVANAREAQPSVKTKESVPSVPSVPVRMNDTPPLKQLSATELLQQHYNEIRKAKQQAHIEKINRFKSSMF